MQAMVKELQGRFPGCIMLFQLGDYLHAFGEDADTLRYICGIYAHEGDMGSTASFALVTAQKVIGQLVKAGLRVAIANRDVASLNWN